MTRRFSIAAGLAAGLASLVLTAPAGAAGPPSGAISDSTGSGAATARAAAVGDETPVAPRYAAPSPQRGAWVAKVLVPTPVLSRAGGTRSTSTRRIGTVTPTIAGTGAPQELMVLGRSVVRDGAEWLRVRLASRPNTAAGWIRADHARVRRTTWFVRVRLARRDVTVWHAGRVVRRLDAVIGAPSTPTPRGLFAVQQSVKQTNPAGFLGPWAIHLTAHSNVLDDYGGGAGRVAIHGRGGNSLRDPLGSSRSHGCVRVANDDVRRLSARLRPGTPVQVI